MNNFSNKPYTRSDRLSDRVHNLLANIFIKDFHVELCDLLTVTKVEMTSDLRMAKVFLSLIGEAAEPQAIISYLSKNRKQVRYLLGSQLETKYVPDLRFYYDESIRNASKINNILKKI